MKKTDVVIVGAGMVGLTMALALVEKGFKVVIYANHMLRAAYPSMLNIGRSILKNGRSFEIEKKITPIKEIISLIK